MTSWTRIRELFERSADMNPAERATFLDEACEGDETLRSEVLRLLDADDTGEHDVDVIDDALIGAESGDAYGRSLIGHRIGRFEVLSRIASGGMGTVYEAQQEHPNRRVALKVMRQGLASPSARQRFDYEAQILSRLRHPGIAQVFEASAMVDEEQGDEVPYFAMEFIEGGRTLIDYAHAEDLDLDARVELFAEVCGIVHYGHQQGVIHRDLKPSNILVDFAGRPKIIDFGIARAVEHEGDTSQRTRIGEVLGTLQYMSPEQMAGDPDRVDTRTDIYALGVVLYELICGCSPFGLLNKSLPEAVRIVSETQPVRPDHVRPDLPRDLVWITMRTLEKDRDRRYGSAAELQDELRRFRANEPVRANSPSTRYRLKKFLQRHKSEAVIGGLLFAVLTIGPVVTSLVLARLNNNLQTANERYGRLADSLRLEELTQSAEELWPASPSNVRALAEWVAEGRALADRLPVHRATLASIRRAAEGGVDSTEIRWQHQVLAELVADLERFSDPDPTVGTLAEIERRLASARTVVERSLVQYELEWTEAREAIRRSPLYDELDLEPQVGLVPIGRDPHSGLWEFAHVDSGEPPPRIESEDLAIGPQTSIVMVLIPGGTFAMGAVSPAVTEGPLDPKWNTDPFAASDESPVRDVELEPFFISKFELHQAQWQRLAGRNPSYFTPTFLVETTPLTDTTRAWTHPVEQVSWNEGLEVLSHHGLTLPTEAQWEYAARARTRTVWWTGDDRESLRGRINIADQSATRLNQDWGAIADWPGLEDGYPFHAPVDAFDPNPFGLYNVLGNVNEWCLDGVAEYEMTPVSGTGLRVDESRHSRIVRGGSFMDSARKARSADRGFLNPDSFDLHLGLRPARAIDRSTE